MEQTKKKWLKLSKLPNEVEFRPITAESKERFSVWDNKERKFLNDNEKITTSKGEWVVSKFIKLKDLTQEEQNRWRRNLQYIREVVYNGENSMFPLSQSLERALLGKMDDIQKMGHNPLEWSYIIKRSVVGGLNKYELTLGKKQVQLSEKIQLTDFEKEVVDAIKSDNDARNKSISEKIDILKMNEISEERAKLIVKDYL